MTLLIVSSNEEEVIESRLRNALGTDYPPELFEIVVATDGSSDRTPEIIRKYAARGIKLLPYPRQRGKAATLNDAIPETTGDILLLSDSNTFLDPSAARNLVRWFDDPRIGAVSGRLILTDPVTGRNVDGLYWKYETFLKKCESRLGALLGANGSIYAIRRSLYQPLPPDTAVDDFMIPLLMRLKSGCRIIYDPQAIAREESPPNLGDEFGRRARIGAGNLHALRILRSLLAPRNGWVAFTFLSHKVLRWICPLALVTMLAASALLQKPYRIALVAQILFYLASMLAAVAPLHWRIPRCVRLTTMFTNMNAALLVGTCRSLTGHATGAWQRTSRAAVPSDPIAEFESA